MNRFFRTAYSTTLIYLIITFVLVTVTGVSMPFPSFLCLYFSLLVFLLPGAVHRLEDLRVLFGVLGAVVALAGFAFLIHHPLGHVIVYAVCVALAGVFLVVLRHNTTHDDFQGKFSFTLIAAAVFLAMFILAAMTENNIFELKPESVKRAMLDAVPIAMVSLATGVLLLRGLRAQQGIVDQKAFNRRQLRDTLIFSGIVGAVFSADPYKYLSMAVRFIMEKIVRPIIVFLSDGAKWILEQLRNPNPPNYNHIEYTEPPTELVQITPPPEIPQVTRSPEQVAKDSESLFNTLMTIFIIVIIAFLLLLLYELFKKLIKRDRSKGSGYPNEIKTEIPPEEEEKKEDKPGRFSRDPRLKMRFFYREYIRHLRSSKIPVNPSDTCAEINMHAQNTLKYKQDQADEFTRLYENARYSFDEEPQKKDADRMKKLLSELKEK